MFRKSLSFVWGELSFGGRITNVYLSYHFCGWGHDEMKVGISSKNSILHSGICDWCAFHVCARLRLMYGLGRRCARANITLDVYLRLTKMCVCCGPPACL